MKNIAIKGDPASPDIRQMLSLIRYRRIPYEYIIINGLDSAGCEVLFQW